jgi:hypothetical protein
MSFFASGVNDDQFLRLTVLCPSLVKNESLGAFVAGLAAGKQQQDQHRAKPITTIHGDLLFY